MGVACEVCGKDTKKAGHIMTECLASHRLTNKLSVGIICPKCGKDTKSGHHIMAHCLLQHDSMFVKEGPDMDSLSYKGREPRPKPETTAPPPLRNPESQKRPSFNTMLANLRRVPMGKFMRDAVKEMEHLPFVLTRDGKDFAIVGPIKGSET